MTVPKDCVLIELPAAPLIRIQKAGFSGFVAPVSELPPVVRWLYERLRAWPARPSRYDAPDASYAVTYCGSNLEAALYELLSGLRVEDRILDRLRRVRTSSPISRYPLREIPENEIVAREVLWLLAPSNVSVNLMNATARVGLSFVPTINHALRQSGRTRRGKAYLLDSGVLHSQDNASYRVCQQISKHIHDVLDPVVGVRYVSRTDERWECWALFDRAKLSETKREMLNQHGSILTEVLSSLDLRLTPSGDQS